MIKIDFVAVAHGHFLEYVANVYIMQTLPSNTSIFTDAGASHRADAAYFHNKIIKCGHFSYENYPIDTKLVYNEIQNHLNVIRYE